MGDGTDRPPLYSSCGYRVAPRVSAVARLTHGVRAWVTGPYVSDARRRVVRRRFLVTVIFDRPEPADEQDDDDQGKG